MNILGFEISRQKRDTVTVPNPVGGFMPVSVKGGVDAVGNQPLAMKIAAVYRCVDILSKGVAQLPLTVKHRMPEGYFEQDEDDIFGLSYLLSVRPNDRMSAFEFMRSMMVQIVLQGNAYIVPQIGADGEYRSLQLCAPASVVYNQYSNEYTVNDTINHISGVYGPDDIIHVKNLGLNGGFSGVSTLAYAGKVLAISANADADNVETFKNGGMVKGLVSGAGSAAVGFGVVQQSQLDSVSNNLENQMKAGKSIMTVPEEVKFTQLSLSPSDIELLNTKQFNVLEICRFFGVHPDKVFAQQSSNYKASEMSQVAFLTDTLQPYLRQIELEFQTKLIGRDLYKDWRLDFDIEPLMQTDLATKAAYMEKTIGIGVRSVNDWRRDTGKAPVEGGDEVLVSANLKAVKDVAAPNSGISE